MNELSSLRGSERYEACEDAVARIWLLELIQFRTEQSR